MNEIKKKPREVSKKKAKISLKFEMILIFMIILLIVISVIGSTGLSRGSTALTKELEGSLLMLAKEGAKSTTSELRRSEETLITLSKLGRIKNMDWEEQDPVLKAVIDSVGFLNLGVIDIDGNIRFVERKDIDISDSEIVKESMENGSIGVEYIKHDLHDKSGLLFSVPILKEEKIVGAIIGYKRPTDLSKVSDISGSDPNSSAFIMDAEGTMIGYPKEGFIEKHFNPIEKKNVDEKFNEAAKLFKHMMVTERGIGEFKYEDKEFYTGFQTIEGTDWTFVTTKEMGSFMAPMKSLKEDIINISLILVSTSLVIVFIFSSSVSKSITDIADISTDISDLDISKDIPDYLLRKKDETGLLANNFQDIIYSLREVVEELYEATDSMNIASEELLVSSEESNDITYGVSRATINLAKDAEIQVLNTDEGLDQAAYLDETLVTNQKRLKDLNIISEKVREVVREGKIEMDNLSDITDESIDSITEVERVIMNSIESVKEIERVSNIIGSVAEQTNLLALNSAIQASKAGETGKGFGVIAEEIRKLSEQSAEFTDDINNILKDIENNSKESIEVVKQIINISDEQVKGVNLAKEDYKIIEEAIQDSEAVVERLNESERAIFKGKDKIVETLNNLVILANNNMETTEDVKLSMRKQLNASVEVSDLSKGLSRLSERLRESIHRFKV